MPWTDHIHADPAIAGGKPVLKNTRLAVDFILALLAEGVDARSVTRDLSAGDR